MKWKMKQQLNPVYIYRIIIITIIVITLDRQQQLTLKWNNIKGNCNKIIEIILMTQYGQRIIINGDIWKHNLQNTLSNHTAVTITSISTIIIITNIQ